MKNEYQVVAKTAYTFGAKPTDKATQTMLKKSFKTLAAARKCMLKNATGSVFQYSKVMRDSGDANNRLEVNLGLDGGTINYYHAANNSRQVVTFKINYQPAMATTEE